MTTGIVETFHPADPIEGQEIDAFHRLIPTLRAEHAGDYVALRGGRVIASGACLDAVCREAVRIAPRRPVYCGWVEPEADGVAFFSRFDVPAVA